MLVAEESMNRLMILCCFTCVCVQGSNEDSSASCQVDVKVKRGSRWSAEAQQSLTVPCPVDHCGKSLNVTWCKHNTDDCERVNEKENVEITQKRDTVKDKLISYLRFRNISVQDGGLYSCELKDFLLTSHTIFISVSDEPQSPADTEPKPWLLYVFISSGFVLLVVMSTLFIVLMFNRLHRSRTHDHSKNQEQFPPATSKASELTLTSSSVVLTCRSVLNDIVSTGNQPDDDDAAEDDEVQDSSSVMYASINHSKSGTVSRRQHTSTLDKNPEYAAINVP